MKVCVGVKQKKIHPAWFVLAGCCLVQFGSSGILGNSMGIFTPPVTSEFGFTNASFSMHATIRGIASMMVLPFAGRMFPRIKLRRLIGIMALLNAVPAMCMSMFSSLYQWYAASIIYGIGSAFITMTLSPIVLSNWFHKKRGFAVGIAMSFSGVGGAVMNPFGTWLIDVLGWRWAYVILGGIALLCMLPFALTFLHYHPSEIGVLPYGYEPEEAGAPSSAQELPDNPIRDKNGFLKTPLFYLFFVTVCCIAFPIVFNTHFAQFAVSIGMATAFGASMSSVSMIGNIGAKLGLGWLCDRLSIYKTILLGTVLVIIGLFLILLGQSVPMLLLIGAFFVGISMSLTSVSVPMIVGALFDPEDYSMVLSLGTMATSLMSGGGVLLVGGLYDANGNYNFAFALGIAAYLLLIVVLTLTFALHKKQKSKSVLPLKAM